MDLLFLVLITYGKLNMTSYTILLHTLFNVWANICWGTLGTWVTGLALAFFAYQQNKINSRVKNIELSLRYQDHYKKLMILLEDYKNKENEGVNKLNLALDLKQGMRNLKYEAELLLDKKIIMFLGDLVAEATELISSEHNLISHELELEQLNHNKTTETYYITADTKGIRIKTFCKRSYFKLSEEIKKEIKNNYIPFTQIR